MLIVLAVAGALVAALIHRRSAVLGAERKHLVRLATDVAVHDAAESPESELIGGAIQENKELVARANPITYVTNDTPPFLIIHGEKATKAMRKNRAICPSGFKNLCFSFFVYLE